MQHRYVADVGDYLKLALLRQLQPHNRLGVVWWLFPDESHNSDGRHIDYLEKPAWRTYDPNLFDALQSVVRNGQRSIQTLESAGILGEATFFSDYVPVGSLQQDQWLCRAIERVEGCNLVFLDPDNGLEPRSFVRTRKAAGKSVSYVELAAFRRTGRTVVVYHHQTRAPGGHLEEIRTLSSRLADHFGTVDAVRASAYSPRVFFLLDAAPEIRARAQELCECCEGKMTFNPHLPPEGLALLQ